MSNCEISGLNKDYKHGQCVCVAAHFFGHVVCRVIHPFQQEYAVFVACDKITTGMRMSCLAIHVDSTAEFSKSVQV